MTSIVARAGRVPQLSSQSMTHDLLCAALHILDIALRARARSEFTVPAFLYFDF